MAKRLDESAMGHLLQQEETEGDSWKIIRDVRNSRLVKLSDNDILVRDIERERGRQRQTESDRRQVLAREQQDYRGQPQQL